MKFKINLIILVSAISLVLLGLILHLRQAKAEINAAIIVIPTEGLVTGEDGTSDSFTIRLDSQPGAQVRITLTSSMPDEGIVSPNTVQFTQGNWNNPKIIEVIGVPDGIEDGDVLYEITGISDSTDGNFNGLVMPPVSVTNLNDSVPIAIDDLPAVNGYTPIVIPVLDNDTGLFDIPIVITVISNPSFGSYIINLDDTITYTPSQATFSGVDQFTYQVCDVDGDCATADVIIEDQVPPVILSAFPVDIGKRLDVDGGEVTIGVTASDNFQVDCVNFIRWDHLIEEYIQLGEVCKLPYEITVVVGDLNYGWNQVYFQASDVAGNLSPHSFIWLYRVNRTYLPLVLSP